jgi:hypothetical protein
MPSWHGQGQIYFLPKQVLKTNRDTGQGINGGKFILCSCKYNIGHFELTDNNSTAPIHMTTGYEDIRAAYP